VARYRRDLAEARARLSHVDRWTIRSVSGPLEHSEWGEGVPLLPVHGVAGSELGRGRGGPRCMSYPIEREALPGYA
jgi:Arginine deiminase